VAALRDPAFYPDPPTAVEVHETAISYVFLAGERAYKLKKPVVLPYLDYGTAERRRRMCEREVALNRRLAPDVYLGLRAVASTAGTLELVDANHPDAIEHVVEMRRFDPSSTLSEAIRAGRVTADDVGAVARLIAQAHEAAAPVRRSGRELLASLKHVADGNFEELLARGVPPPRSVLAAQRFSDAFLAGHLRALTARARAGCVRDGHGDLRAEHVLLGEQIQVVDCAEFDDALREIDVGADLAFLAMDLERLERRDLARVLVDAYRAHGGDPGSDRLIAFHAARYAWVRAKVALVGGVSAAGTRQDALELFALGERLAWRARMPLVLVVCGPPASGKSHLAQALSRASGLRSFGSDETRKRLAGLPAVARAPAAAYTPEAGVRTYAELGRVASAALREDGGVVVDATFGATRDRQAFTDAFDAPETITVVECRAPAAILDARARRRESQAQRVSDAGPDVARTLRERFEPLADSVPAARHVTLRTDQPAQDVLDDLLAALDRALARDVADR